MGLEGLIFHSGFCIGRCYIHSWAGSRCLIWSWDLNLGFQAGTKQQKVMITWNPSRKTSLLYANYHCHGSVTSPDLCSRPTMLPEVWRKCLVSQKLTKETTLLVNFTVIFCMPSFTFLSSQSNTTITPLELEDKCILVEGAICVVEMLWDNSSRTGTWSGIVCSQNYCSSSSIFWKKTNFNQNVQASEKQKCAYSGSLLSPELLSSLADVTVITITKLFQFMLGQQKTCFGQEI